MKRPRPPSTPPPALPRTTSADGPHARPNPILIFCSAGEKSSRWTNSKDQSIVLGYHAGRVHKISLNPVDPHSFLSCGEDGLCLTYDVRTNESRFAVKFLNESGKRVPINSVNHDPLSMGNRFALAGSDKYVRIYDYRFLREGEPWHKVRAEMMKARKNWFGGRWLTIKHAQNTRSIHLYLSLSRSVRHARCPKVTLHHLPGLLLSRRAPRYVQRQLHLPVPKGGAH